MRELIEIAQNNALLLLIGQYPNGPLGGLALTLILSIASLLLAFPLSVLIALARLSHRSWLRMPAAVLVSVVRGVPLLMLIFWTYFFLPLVLGGKIDGVTTMIATLVIYESAYLSEIVRAGIESLPKGQMEAARALGLSHGQAMRKIIVPQALHSMLPAIVTQFSTLIKDTSLGYVIGVHELTYAANQVNTTLLTQPFQVFFLLALMYFAVCFALSRSAAMLERSITAKRAGASTLVAPPHRPEAPRAQPTL